MSELSDTHADTHVMAMFNLASRAADLVMNQSAARDRVFGTCATQTTAACVTSNFIPGFALRAYRRPLLAAESTNVLNAFNTASGDEGLKRALIHVLLAPSMAYHLEAGTVVGDRVKLTDYAIASRLSYQITGSLPDAALFAAAANGQLVGNLKNVMTQAKRLVTSNPDARKQLLDFFRVYLLLDSTPNPNTGAAIAAGITADDLRQELMTEMNEYIENVVFTKQGTFADLMSSTDVFPRSDRMAKILETRSIGSTGRSPASTNANHAGLILRPALLAGSSIRTNPMTRASRVLKRVMCVTMASPDLTQVEEQVQHVGDQSGMTNRERYTELTSPPQCMGCHTMLNPVGFAFENYNQLGMVRSEEVIADGTGQVTERFAVDTRYDGQPLETHWTGIRDGQDLSEAIATGSVAKSCFAKSIYEFQHLRVISADDHCALNELEKVTASEKSVLEAWVSSTANEDIFWKAYPN